MDGKFPRRYVPVRLSADGYARVSQLADQETEGNVSQMVRKLLVEALAARPAPVTQANTR